MKTVFDRHVDPLLGVTAQRIEIEAWHWPCFQTLLCCCMPGQLSLEVLLVTDTQPLRDHLKWHTTVACKALNIQSFHMVAQHEEGMISDLICWLLVSQLERTLYSSLQLTLQPNQFTNIRIMWPPAKWKSKSAIWYNELIAHETHEWIWFYSQVCQWTCNRSLHSGGGF